MTPFAGVGVNLAMMDALDLSTTIMKVEENGLLLRVPLSNTKADVSPRRTVCAEHLE